MATLNDVLAVARGEVGVTEWPERSNNVKYNTEYYGRQVYGDDAFPWCMVFVWWVFKHAGGSELFFDGKKTASCPTYARWAMGTGRWVTADYKPGDVVIFRFEPGGYDHVGIVEMTQPDGTYITIEGNTSVSSDDNGGAVMRRFRYAHQIVGAYRPEYRNEKAEPDKEPEQEKQHDTKEEPEMTYEEFKKLYERARDETDPFYKNLEDVPDYWQDEVRALLSVAAIQGDGVHEVGKRRSELQAMIPAARYVDWYFGEPGTICPNPDTQS